MVDIRHISTSFKGPKITLAEFDKIVQIIDIVEKEKISEFETILDFGGKRVAIDNSGKICICASYEKNLVCGYETITGNKIWQRKDIKKVQVIRILTTPEESIFIQSDKGPGRILNIFTGEDIILLPGIENFFESNFQTIQFHERKDVFEIVDRITLNKILSIKRKSFALLDMAFSKDSILISESGGPASCYDLENGELKWILPLDSDGHFLKLCYNEICNQFLAISWPFQRGGNKKLKYLNLQNGNLEKELTIDRPAETEFALEGNLLITSEKLIINTLTGLTDSW